jgi:hypothetical protein
MSIIRSNFLAESSSGRVGRDRAGVVDHNVDATEVLDRGVDGALYVLFLAHVTHHRDALAARGFDVGDGGVDGAGQLGVRLGRLGQQHDVGAVFGGPQRDRQPDAATTARDDERAVGERGHGPPWTCELPATRMLPDWNWRSHSTQVP